MGQNVTVVDAFTTEPFRGNPAAVCLLPAPANNRWMQAIAAEMNLSETAFVHPESGDPGVYRLRWFTPALEVDLCGHATLAAAHVLWEEGRIPTHQPIAFVTRSGRLAAHRAADWILLDFPAEPPFAEDPPAGLIAALGVPPVSTARNRFDWLCELESESAVRALNPDVRALRQLPVRGIMVTARADDENLDFVSRFFAPAAGVDEDPVTGSAHCALGPYWGPKLNKTELLARQVSRRTGVVRIGLRGPRVELGGQAVTVLRGELAEALNPDAD